MGIDNDLFSVKLIETLTGETIHFIQIIDPSEKQALLIDSLLVSIWDKSDQSQLDIVKLEIANYLKTKSPEQKMGSIAEFLVHCYLNSIGFNQECLFRNLEEGSIKKGFDGYYSYLNEEWLVESKSGSIQTKHISHSKKVDEAYLDLKTKIEGKSKNNPWSNAFHHAKLAGATTDIVNNIKNLSNNYVRKIFPEIKDLNIIPTSTIFYENMDEQTFLIIDEEEISKQITKFDFSKINIICINKKSIEDVIKLITITE
jgi:hypothetical protein